MNASGSVDLVLVHSPLVGRSFWQPVARELEHHGWRCYVPSAYRAGTDDVPWHQWPDRLRETLPAVPGSILIGHSAAGMLLPVLAERLGAGGVIFVDASVPPPSGVVPPASPEFMQLIHALPVTNGRLPRWSDWWGKDVITTLMPDPEARRRFEEELPQLPVDWFDDWVDVPAWDGLRAAYVQTSDRFAPDAHEARAKGWPVEVLNGTHLHPVLAPVETARALLAVIGRTVEAR